MNEGDWVEGEPKWWWKYVFPSRELFWTSVLRDRILVGEKVRGPQPEPWREEQVEILEGLVLLQAATTISEAEVSQKLKLEAVEKIIHAAGQLRG